MRYLLKFAIYPFNFIIKHNILDRLHSVERINIHQDVDEGWEYTKYGTIIAFTFPRHFLAMMVLSLLFKRITTTLRAYFASPYMIAA